MNEIINNNIIITKSVKIILNKMLYLNKKRLLFILKNLKKYCNNIIH